MDMYLSKYDEINDITIYQNPLQDDNKILKGYNNGKMYLISNPKGCYMLHKMFLHKLRKEKLVKINTL